MKNKLKIVIHILLFIHFRKLLKHRHRALCSIFTRHHMRTQLMHNLTESDRTVVIGIDNLQEILDLPISVTQTHGLNQPSELMLVQHTVVISIDLLEQQPEFLQELFVFAQLEVKHAF